MTAFVVTYTTKSGQRREMTLTADNPSVARRELRRRGILPNTLVRKEAPKIPQGGGAKKTTSSFSVLADLLEGPVTIRDKALFANKLSALVDAGVPILRSLDLMRMQQRSKKMRMALAGMTQDVNQGDSLGNSMRRWPKVFDNLSIALVEAGEAGGVLDDTLKRLAKLLEDNAKLQNQIKGAMSYPVTVLVIAIAVFLGMTIFLIPTFSSVFDQLGAELPLFTQMMLNLSEFLRSWKALILLGGLVGFAFWVVATYKTPIGRRQIDGLMLKLPLFGELLVKTASAQFCRTLSSLSKAGVPILLSLEIVRETATNSVISDAIISCKNEVSEGMPLSAALRLKNVFPEMCVNMLAIGEETGEMDAMLSKVADFYEDEVTTMVKAMTSMLEPAMIVLVGIIVGSVLLAMYLPMFSIYEHVR
ncbi:type II secretion system F family protein [Cyanobium sp. AMD-g]|uniref:type II secretion system F family protein n=1 Tax=Cyanobium sp. AMD-g TaxID=2823699 RepID=UPI0020CC962D|nr:type II secretion system F family protein [Cyanobium sp. AMD-g]MCP9930470.1 type II secretion system F family protein [Cyanobium sp. AMD-g]